MPKRITADSASALPGGDRHARQSPDGRGGPRQRAAGARGAGPHPVASMPHRNWGANPDALAALHRGHRQGDIIIATMLFMEDHIQAVLPALTGAARQLRRHGVLHVGGEVIKLTRLGRFDMGGKPGHHRQPAEEAARPKTNKDTEKATAGEKQLAMLKRLPQDPALHSGLGPGRARLFPRHAILAGGLGREHRPSGPLPRLEIRRRPAQGPARHRLRATAELSGSRASITRAWRAA